MIALWYVEVGLTLAFVLWWGAALLLGDDWNTRPLWRRIATVAIAAVFWPAMLLAALAKMASDDDDHFGFQ